MKESVIGPTERDLRVVDLAAKFTSVKRKENESDFDFILRILPAISALSDEEWDELGGLGDDLEGADACDWFNANARKVASSKERDFITWPSGRLVKSKEESHTNPKNPNRRKVSVQAIDSKKEKAPEPKTHSPVRDHETKPTPSAKAPSNGRISAGYVVRELLLENPSASYKEAAQFLQSRGLALSKSSFDVLKYEFRQTIKFLQERGVMK